MQTARRQQPPASLAQLPAHALDTRGQKGLLTVAGRGQAGGWFLCSRGEGGVYFVGMHPKLHHPPLLSQELPLPTQPRHLQPQQVPLIVAFLQTCSQHLYIVQELRVVLHRHQVNQRGTRRELNRAEQSRGDSHSHLLSSASNSPLVTRMRSRQTLVARSALL
eukprot:725208-Hanusia_phi.AAC.1